MQKLPVEIAKPIFAIMYKKDNEKLFQDCLKIIENNLGKIDFISSPYHFSSLENYYSKEMGKPILKVFLSLENFILKSNNEDENILNIIQKYNNYVDELKEQKNKLKILNYDIVDLKLLSMEIENTYRDRNNNRQINLDVGYLDEFQLVLASHKRRGARIYVGKGIYLELEYLYFNKDFQDLFWTYMDYREKKVKEIFKLIRKKFLEDRKVFIKSFNALKI